MAEPTAELYGSALRDYLRTRSEDALYRASLLSRASIEAGLGPEEIIALHSEAFVGAIDGLTFREQAHASTDALSFLLEVMIAYGVQHRELLDVRVAAEREAASQDLTDARGRLEQLTQAEQGMEESLARIAHELRTPLMAALSNVDLVMRVLESGQTDRIPRFLGSARDALLRLSRLSGELLDVSRGVPPQLQHVPLELPLIVSQACSWAASVAEAKGVELIRAGGPFSLRVIGDEDALLTILGNLLSNAIRYTASGGSVTVRHWADGDRAIVEVRDTGIGIAPDALPHVFEPFYRSTEGRLADAEGLGLGLTLAQRFTAVLDGRIDIESRLGIGSAFRIVLPRVHESVPQEEKA